MRRSSTSCRYGLSERDYLVLGSVGGRECQVVSAEDRGISEAAGTRSARSAEVHGMVLRAARTKRSAEVTGSLFAAKRNARHAPLHAESYPSSGSICVICDVAMRSVPICVICGCDGMLVRIHHPATTTNRGSPARAGPDLRHRCRRRDSHRPPGSRRRWVRRRRKSWLSPARDHRR